MTAATIGPRPAVNPDRPHAYRLRRVTADRLRDSRGWLTNPERPCDTCGGSKRLPVHGIAAWGRS